MKPLLLSLPLLWAAGLAAAQEVTATDAHGQSLTLPAPAARVVADSITGLGQLLALGIAPVGSFCTPGADAAESLLAERNMPLPAGTPCFSNPDWSNDWEKVAALEPDLFIGWAAEDAALLDGIAPFFSAQAFATDGSSGDSLDMYDASLRAIGTLTGRDAEAEAAIAATRARVAAYAALAPAAPPRVLHLFADGGAVFWIFGQGSLNCQLLEEIADCAAPGGPDEFYVQGTSELLLRIDPDVLVVVAYAGDYLTDAAGLAAMTAADPLWSELTAVRDGRVVLMPHDARASSVYGINDYLDTIAPRLYPETFPAPLSAEQVAAAAG